MKTNHKPTHRCPTCAYDLSALLADWQPVTCPECGIETTPDEADIARCPTSRRRILGFAALLLFAWPLVLAAIGIGTQAWLFGRVHTIGSVSEVHMGLVAVAYLVVSLAGLCGSLVLVRRRYREAPRVFRSRGMSAALVLMGVLSGLFALYTNGIVLLIWALWDVN